MSAQVQAASLEAVERLHNAMNQHDLEAFLACFDPNYRSEQPAHPIRGFGGREQVEKNWSALFEGIPDFHAGCPPLRRRATLSGRNGIGRAPEQMKRRSTCEE